MRTKLAIGFTGALWCTSVWAQTATATALTMAPPAAVFGQTVTLTAQVTPTAATGAVSFLDKGMLIGSGKIGSGGVAGSKTLTLGPGQHSVQAIYGGDSAGGYQASRSGASSYAVASVAGQGFAPPSSYSIPCGGRAEGVGDLNGDGIADIVVGCGSPSGNGTLYVFLGSGGGAFQPPSTYPLATDPWSLTLADFNGDGAIDVAIANQLSDNISVLLGNADGTFQAPSTYMAGSDPVSIVAGDFNRDGNPDLVVANFGSGNVSVFLGNGDGTFQPAATYPTGNGPMSVGVGDFNGDGYPDLAVAKSPTSSNVGILLGNGDGTFRTPVNYPAYTYPASVVICDFNLDGKLDVAVADFYDQMVMVLLGNGDGTFGSAIQTPAPGPIMLAAGDFNGDGIPDLAASNANGTSISVLIGSGHGTFVSLTSVPVPEEAIGVAIGDFNNDGIADVAASLVNGLSVLLGLESNATVTTLRSSSNPSTFGEEITLTAAVSPSNATGAIEFLNGTQVLGGKPLVNGQAQILTSLLPSGGNSLTAIFEGTGNWVPGKSSPLVQTIKPVPSTGLVSSASPSAGTAPVAVVVSDFNNDGIPDLAVVDSGASVEILLGQGHGAFAALVPYQVGQGANWLAVGDFNRDGNQDLVVDGNANPEGAALLLGNGNGTFQAAQNIPISDGSAFVAVADVNLDGNPDLIAAGAGYTNVLLGNGNGTFQTPMFFLYGAPTSYAIGDFNGDGIPDLATTAQSTPSIGLQIGNGNGTFQTPVFSQAAADGAAVIAADVNGDGKLDLIFTEFDLGEVGLMLGNGNGTFQTVTSYCLETISDQCVPEMGAKLAVADVNGDGKLDVVVTATVQGQLYVLLGNGDGSLQTGTATSVGSSPVGLAIADFNGDGTADIAVANSGSNNLNILLGTANITSVEPTAVGPTSGSGQSQTFTFTFTDPNGYGDLSVLDVLVNNYLDGIGACYFALVPTSASTGYVFLVDDASDGGYSAGSPMPVPSGNTTANSQCSITGNGTFSGSGNTLTVTVPITFSGSFTGNKVFYTAARSSTQNSGWQALGTWNVPQATTSGPGVQGVTPSRGTSSGQTYTFSFSDTSGWQSLDVVDVLTNSLLDGIGACYFAYVPTSATTGYVYLLDDAGDGGYVSGTPMAIPGTGSLQNSQCTINALDSSATASGNVLDVNLAMTFSPSFAGNKVFFLAARDHGSGNSGWQASGLVNIP